MNHPASRRRRAGTRAPTVLGAASVTLAAQKAQP